MKFSLRAKTVMLIVAIALVLGLAGTMISVEAFRDIIDTTYKTVPSTCRARWPPWWTPSSPNLCWTP